LSQQLVVLNSPSLNVDLNDTLPSFSWQSMGIADSYNIVLKSGTNWTTGSVLIDDTVTINSYNSSVSLTEGQYIWGVRAINSLSYTTSFNQRALNIDLTNPPKPVPSSPTNSSSQVQGLLNFSWTRPTDVGTYNSSRYDSLYVFSDTAMTVLQGKYYSLNTNFSVNINQNDTFFWYLIGFDAAGNKSDTSNVFSFTIP
jgi:predicted phage tail protein